jgi:hypothetical protein
MDLDQMVNVCVEDGCTVIGCGSSVSGMGRAIEYIGMYEREDFVAKRKQLQQIIFKYQRQDDDAVAIGNRSQIHR